MVKLGFKNIVAEMSTDFIIVMVILYCHAKIMMLSINKLAKLER